MAIIIPKIELKIMKKHAAEIFPYEACGGLLGRLEGENKVVVRVYPAENRFGKIAWDSFEIEPQDMLEMDKISRKEGLEILGFYHSHPNHPAIPSSFDINASWPYYSYVILSVKGKTPGGAADLKSYLIPDKNSAPVPEDIRLVV